MPNATMYKLGLTPTHSRGSNNIYLPKLQHPNCIGFEIFMLVYQNTMIKGARHSAESVRKSNPGMQNNLKGLRV